MPGVRGAMQRHQLVVAARRRLRGGARLGRADGVCLPAHVDHDDLVAETVHLDEGVVGERAHAESLFTPPYMGKATLLASAHEPTKPGPSEVPSAAMSQ